MKNFFLFIFLLVGNLTFAQIPNLAKRTLEGNINDSDIINQQNYMVNVDTSRWATETISGEITYYNSKEKMIEKLNSLFCGLKLKNITHFAEIKDNPYILPRKLHWVMFVDKYRIDWWFDICDISKLDTITLVKN